MGSAVRGIGTGIVPGDFIEARASSNSSAEGDAPLNLYECRLTALPPEIGNLASLKFLSLEKNRLRTVLTEVAGLAQIQSIFLTDNPIQSLPPEVAEMPALRRK